jgi:peroxiredoxin
MPNRTTLLIILVAILGALAGFWAGGALRAPNAPTPNATPASVTIGGPAPDFALPDLAGATRTLAEFHGRPLLVNFWATWCAPCVEEMPLLAALRARHADAGLEVIGIALDDPVAVRAFVAELAIGYPILLDIPGRADSSVRFGDTRGVLPFSVLVDARGRIAAVRAGSFSAATLADFVAPVVGTD